MALDVSQRLARKPLATNALTFVAMLMAALILVARATGYGPWGGDIAVWIFVHEWVGRGVPIYAGVWDHKDWGFFAITRPFYDLAGITGLYVSGLLASVIFAVGTFLSTLSVVAWRKAAMIASVAAATYVVAPSYLSTYTENYAISLAVLAVGLISRFPFAAGVVFALSASVKVSGLLLFVLVVGTAAALSHQRRWGPPRLKSQVSVRAVAGFGLGALAIVAIANAQGALDGWLTIISYNSEYAAIRREDMPPLMDVMALLGYSSPGLPTGIFGAAIVVAILGLLILLIVSARNPQESGRPTFSGSALALNAALLVGAVIAVSAQYPPFFQHYQYLVGPALSLSAVLFATLLVRSDSRRRVIGLGAGLLLVAPLTMGITLIVRSEGPAFVASDLIRWSQLTKGGDPLLALNGVPVNSKVAFVDVGGTLTDPESIPGSADLQCRFFYQYPHLLPRYGEEILNCLRQGPEYVVVRPGGFSDEVFQMKVRAILASGYVRCSTSDPVFELWSSDSSSCPSGTMAPA